MLQLRPLLAEPEGTRPSIPGCLCEPGPHLPSGVAAELSFACWTATLAGVSPPAWPSAKRSLSGFDAPTATVAAATAGTAVSALRISLRLFNRTPPARPYFGRSERAKAVRRFGCSAPVPLYTGVPICERSEERRV